MTEAPRGAVDKALDLVEAVARSPHPPRLTDLAEEVGLHRATAYRVLLDLVRRGWVLRAGDRYLPGTAVLRLASSAAGNSLAAVARPVLVELSARTGMMANLQVLEGDRSRVIDAVRPERLAMITDLVGEGLPVHRFAGPLTLVAALAPAARAPYLRPAEAAGYPLEGPDGLLADLERAGRTGFAVEHGRNEQPVASIGRAVVPAPGAPVCAVTVVGLDAEFTPARLSALRAHLREATDDLQRLLTAPGASAAASASAVADESAASGASAVPGASAASGASAVPGASAAPGTERSV